MSSIPIVNSKKNLQVVEIRLKFVMILFYHSWDSL